MDGVDCKMIIYLLAWAFQLKTIASSRLLKRIFAYSHIFPVEIKSIMMYIEASIKLSRPLINEKDLSIVLSRCGLGVKRPITNLLKVSMVPPSHMHLLDKSLHPFADAYINAARQGRTALKASQE